MTAAVTWPLPVPPETDALTHPALTEPRTKEQWARYVLQPEPERPKRLTMHDYNALNDLERAAYNRQRDAAHSAMVIVQTPFMDQFERRLAQRLRLNACAAAGARYGLLLSGEARLGKSTLVKVVSRNYELALRQANPELFTGAGNEYIPVAYLLVPSKATTKGMMRALVTYYNLPVREHASADEMMSAVVNAMVACRTSLLVIDDLHFLDASRRDGRDASTMLKALANTVPATFVCVGINLEDSALYSTKQDSADATQNSGRTQRISVQPFAIGTTEEKTQWVALIKKLESALVLLDHEEGTLAQDWKYLHNRTGGGISSILHLLSDAAVEAQDSGLERIDRKLLDTLEADYATQSAQGTQEVKPAKAMRSWSRRR